MSSLSKSATTPASPSLYSLITASKQNKAAEVLAIGFLVGNAVIGGIRRYREHKRNQRTVSLRFEEGTTEYRWLCRWLAEQPKIEDGTSGRSFVVTHLDCGDACVPRALGDNKPAEISRRAWALLPENFQGYRFENLTLSIEREQPQKGSDSFASRRVVILTCVTRDMPSVERLLAAIYDAGTRSDGREIVPRVLTWGHWEEWSEVRKAPLNRMPVLPQGILDEMARDMEWFLKNEEWYQSVGVPYRRGYLFHGIPGSGKTTTAIALAARFRKDIYVLPLDGLSDEKLLQAINRAGRDGIILIEDIDCASVTNERETQTASWKKESPTLQGLLNAIDGAATPEGRIVIGTTNRRDVLDKALIRPGRIDRQWEFVHADHDQTLELCHRFGLNGEAAALAREWTAEKLSMAAVQERLIEKCGLGKQQP